MQLGFSQEAVREALHVFNGASDLAANFLFTRLEADSEAEARPRKEDRRRKVEQR